MRDPSQQKTPYVESPLDRFAVGATHYIGSTLSLILHSLFFVAIFGLVWLGVPFEKVMLILTTAVSLEAIYLSIFIQLTVNRQARQLEEVSVDVDDIQEDVEEISKDVDGIQEDVEEISKDIDDIQEDVGNIQEEAKEIGEDVDDIQGYMKVIKEDVEDLNDGFEKEHTEEAQEENQIARLEKTIEELLREVKRIKKN